MVYVYAFYSLKIITDIRCYYQINLQKKQKTKVLRIIHNIKGKLLSLFIQCLYLPFIKLKCPRRHFMN